MNTKKSLSGQVNEVACQSVMWYNHFGGCTTLVCEKEGEGVLMSIMSFFVLILLLIVVIGVVNERVFHVQSDIALILFSLIICGGLYGVSCIPGMEELSGLLRRLGNFGFEEYLIDTVLCFMLFAGAGKVNMRKFRGNIKPICLLALISTILSSGFFGVLFWVGMKCLGVNMDIWTCILLGSIVSPTDPIAATGILNKLGLSKNVTVVIESESLFNDGTGVALFLFVKSLVTHSGGSNFFMVMFQEVAGAFVVAFAVSFLMTKLMALSRDPVRHILISLLTVSMVYGICEHFHFSGVIASVVCGMFVAARRGKMEGRIRVEDPHERYEDFWEVSEGILNAVLFVMIGLSLLALELSPFIWALIPLAGPIIAVVKAYSYAFTPYILFTRPELSSTEALRESMRETYGKKSAMFCADFVFGIAVTLVLLVLAGFSAIPFIGRLFGLLYLLTAIVIGIFSPLFTGLVRAYFYDKKDEAKEQEPEPEFV